ncbi:4-hydroxythreonine-4-phosphate dehydrogenase PdxA [Victivallis sp. Marseille-Q1083]|uniref:4-hydroxythreonine-4-phosphate dehydrogenase PdxA n=1 Tax=Victivallis sp. Marseille-Q1083 TaxID=2717288 RepID=UPI00158F007B|nr:4-hydroxythreonine-4-phosphate dehydrogenase PdxA [Victivallis sp. Marseille-Q1083]
MRKRLPVIALTMGDPAGIGPELVVRAAADPVFRALAELVIYGPEAVIAEAAERFAPGSRPVVRPVGRLQPAEFRCGVAAGCCGLAAYETITAATLDALSGKVDALVTAPVNKYSVNLAGIPFTGHTERIAELCGAADFAMMQSAGNLRVAFVTTHIPLREVAGRISRERIVKVARLLNEVVKAEGVTAPKLAAAAINPHAGENGCMGLEDEQVVKPALQQLREEGIAVDGPFPPDTLFIEKIRSGYDGIVSMYHDQGHIPFKMLAFECGVNSTLGLPIIRTSVDHGTAFEIAWRGIADSGSLSAAIRTAALRAAHRLEVGN